MNIYFQNGQIDENELCIVKNIFANDQYSTVKASEVVMGHRAWRNSDRLDLGERIPPIMDPMAAEVAKNEGKKKVWDSVGPEVQQKALHALHTAASKNREITSDDVYLCGFTPPEGKESIMGALMSEGETLGWLQDSDKRRKSNRPNSRSRELHVWISRVFQSPRTA